MVVRRQCSVFVMSVILVLACVIPGFAKSSGSVALLHEVVVSGTTLSPGRYAVRWEAQSSAASVEFVRGKKVVASAPCKLEDRGKKYDSSTVVYGSSPDGANTINEIRFAGSSQVLVFSE